MDPLHKYATANTLNCKDIRTHVGYRREKTVIFVRAQQNDDRGVHVLGIHE